MKKSHILLLLFALCPTLLALGQQYGWTDLSANIPGSPDFSDVFFVSDDEGWMSVSSGPEIYHTTDGGATFQVQTTLYTCNAIHMTNENVGYAGGASGFIYKTTDGGANWNFYGTTVATLVDISFPPNSDTGYCCGFNGNIWSISNTGVTIMNSNINGDLSSISFPANNEEGWVCGGTVIRHYKNNIWNGDQDYPSGGYNAIHMEDTQNGWAVGDNGAIINTSDGQNWSTQQTNPAYILTEVLFINTLEGWVVGSGGGIFHTTNGGLTWDREGVGLSSSILRGIHFTSPTNGYVVGNGKTLLKYGELSGIGEGQQQNDCGIEGYPNPTRGKFQITKNNTQIKFKIQNSKSKIEVVDLFGQVIESNNNRTIEQLNNGAIDFDISFLPSGIYFIRIHLEDQMIVKKIIKL